MKQKFHINCPLTGFCSSTYDKSKPDEADPLAPNPGNCPIEVRITHQHDGEHGFLLLERLGQLIGVAVTTNTRALVWFWNPEWYPAAYAAGCEPITADDWNGFVENLARGCISNPNTQDGRKPLLQQLIQAYTK